MRLILVLIFSLVGVLHETNRAQAGSLAEPQTADTVLSPQNNRAWAGPYMGAVLGFGQGTTRQCDLTCGISGDTDGLSIDPKGGVAGLIAGYNWQFDRTVVGIEGSLMFANMDGAEFAIPPFLCGGFLEECFASINRAATLQGRLGYAFDRTLPFVTAGVAWTEYFGGFTDPFFASGDVSATHFMLGIGVDYALNDSLRLRVEGLHFTDPGTLDFSGPAACCSLDRNEYQVLRLGMTYAF